MKRSSRPRGRPICVWANDQERTEIQRRAKVAGMSQSAFLRAVGLGFEPPSTFDADVVLALARVNADQGRLGGLLKLWLSRGEGAGGVDVATLLEDIRAAQQQIHAAIAAAGVRPRKR